MDEETQEAFRKLEHLLIAQHEQQLAATAELFAKLSAAMKEQNFSARSGCTGDDHMHRVGDFRRLP